MLVFTVVGTPALAVADMNSHASGQPTEANEEPHDLVKPASSNKPEEADSSGTTKLADAKLRACQNREAAINNILGRISDRSQKQLDLFTSIATKTETFYTNKGKTLSNYSALVADVNAKKAAAQSAVDAIKSDSVTFKCDGTDPKGAVTSFKDALKTETSALKDYKTSVKNLIVGVKSVQGTTTSTDNKTTGGN